MFYVAGTERAIDGEAVGGTALGFIALQRITATSNLRLAAKVAVGIVGTASLASLIIYYMRWRRARRQRNNTLSELPQPSPIDNPVDPAVRHRLAVEELVEMGFSATDAEAAAKRCHNDVDAAMIWAVTCERRGGAAAVLAVEVSGATFNNSCSPIIMCLLLI